MTYTRHAPTRSNRPSRLTLLAFALGLLASAPAAQAREYRLTLGGSSTRVDDSGYLVLDDSAWMPGVDIGFQVEVGYSIMVGPRVRFNAGSDSARVFSSFVVDLETLDLVATGRWAIDVTSWLRPFVDLEIGAARTALSIGMFDDSVWTAIVGAWAGLEIRFPPGFMFNNDFSVGLELAGGYLYRSPAAFDDLDGVDLGTLDLRGAVWRVAVAVMW